MCLVTDDKFTHSHKEIISPKVPLFAIVLESDSAVDLNIAVDRTVIFEIIYDVIARLHYSILPFKRYLPGLPGCWVTPKSLSIFNHYISYPSDARANAAVSIHYEIGARCVFAIDQVVNLFSGCVVVHNIRTEVLGCTVCCENCFILDVVSTC